MKKLVLIFLASSFIVACGQSKEKANNESLEQIEQIENEMEESNIEMEDINKDLDSLLNTY